MFPLSKKRADDASRHKAHNRDAHMLEFTIALAVVQWQSGMPFVKKKSTVPWIWTHGASFLLFQSTRQAIRSASPGRQTASCSRCSTLHPHHASAIPSPIFALADRKLFKALSAEETEAQLRKFVTCQLVQLLVGRLMQGGGGCYCKRGHNIAASSSYER